MQYQALAKYSSCQILKFPASGPILKKPTLYKSLIHSNSSTTNGQRLCKYVCACSMFFYIQKDPYWVPEKNNMFYALETHNYHLEEHQEEGCHWFSTIKNTIKTSLQSIQNQATL